MIIFWFVLAIIMMILLISKFRLHAFLSLIIVSIFIGIVGDLPLSDVTAKIIEGFGGTMGAIGIVIVCGVVIGEILEITGGAQKIADSILKTTGKKNSVLATSIIGSIISIPVFCDSGFVILTPIIRALSREGKIPYMSLVIALMGGLLTTHSFVPPTPGPIAAAGILKADIGKVMILGITASIPVIIVITLWANSKYIKKNYPDIAPEPNPEELEQFENIVISAPSTFKSYLPIIVPIILIVIQSVTKQFINQESATASIINFFGTPFVALMIGVGLAFMLPQKINATVTDTWVNVAMQKSAEILLITAAGGAFGKVLQATPIIKVLGDSLLSLGLPAVVAPFLISAAILVAQGSATVALLTTAAIVYPLLGTLGISPELATIAIAAGSFTGVHSNGSYFWVTTRMSGFDLKQSYVAVTLTTIIMGATAFATLIIMSMFVM